MALKNLLLQHLFVTAASAATAGLDGDPKTKVKDQLKAGLFGLTDGPVKEEALDQLVDVVVTAKHFGEDETRAEELLQSIIENTQELFELAHKHKTD